MANYLILDSNEKIASQCIKLIGELDSRSMASYEASIDDFQNRYFQNKNEEERLATLDVILFNPDLVPYGLSEWLSDTILKCKQNGYCSEESPVKFVCLKYEEKGLDVDALIHPHIYDIIFVPLDRLVFLQKMEIISALPKKVTPSHLFSEPVEMGIEVSKTSQVKRINRFGFTLINPVELAKGTLTKIILQLSEDSHLNLMARVALCHPVSDKEEDGFYIQFSFAQMDRNISSAISKFISQEDPDYLDLINDRKAVFKPDPELPAEQLAFRNVLIIGPEKEGFDLREEISSQFFNVKVVAESDYARFQNKYFSGNSELAQRPGTSQDISQTSYSFLVDSRKKSLLEIETPLSSEDYICGYNCKNAFFADDQSWLSLFETETGLKSLEDVFKDRSVNKTQRKLIELKAKDNQLVTMAFEFTHISDQDMRIQIQAPIQQEHEKLLGKDRTKQLNHFDLVILYSEYIPENYMNWLDNFMDKSLEEKYTTDHKPFSFIVIDKQLGNGFSQYLNHPHVLSVFQNKGLVNSLMPTISYALKTPHTLFNSDNQNYVMVDLKAHICKRAQLNFISEFGASITSRAPIQPGSLLYLHGSIYNNAPRGMLPARFYSSEKFEDEDKNEFYVSSFLYFGISDSFLKYVRQWIRDNYAELKRAEMERVETKEDKKST